MATRSLAFAMLLLVILVLGNLSGVSGDCRASELSPILVKCHKFIQKPGPQIPPSETCCEAFKWVNAPCICQSYIKPPVDAVISMEKAVYVARTCGCTVPPPDLLSSDLNMVAPPSTSPIPPAVELPKYKWHGPDYKQRRHDMMVLSVALVLLAMVAVIAPGCYIMYTCYTKQRRLPRVAPFPEDGQFHPL